MTPDLPTRVREAFEAELAKCAGSYDACCEEHQDAALAAVIAVVQEDRTRAIEAFVRRLAGAGYPEKRGKLHDIADDIRHEFGGTTHD